jgi:hypothetical protein
MTDMLERPTDVTPPKSAVREVEGLEWIYTDVVEPAVWVGRFQGQFIGMVEDRGDEGFVALTRLGRNLGRFDTLPDAQSAFLKK